jgi:co-chaperonin GroES (HSP10)
MKIKPCGHYVLVKPVKAEEKDEMLKKAKSFGFEMNENVMRREDAAMTQGVIVAIGFQAWKAYTKDGNGEKWADIGNNVYFKRHVQDLIQDESDLDKDGKPQEYFLMNDENILCVIED